MREKIDDIVDKIILGALSQTEATDELLNLFSVSKRALLADLLDEMNQTHCEYHADIVEGEMSNERGVV